ncbi:MAG: RecX family transcriptional regulator [Tissierellia bacterium]|nr:RecX family transcriptional regulator [Tissierellia bacterium]
MNIEDIKFNEKNMSFTIKLSNDELLKISYEIYEKFQLVKNFKLDSELYRTLKEEDSFNRAREIALRFATYKARTQYEVINKLRQKNIDQKAIDKSIAYLKKQGYIDDKNYAKEFFRQCMEVKNYSLQLTKMKFYQKGLDKSLFEDIISRSFSEDVEYENALKLASKKIRNLNLNDIKDYRKAYSYLLSKGFSYELSKKVLDQLNHD